MDYLNLAIDWFVTDKNYQWVFSGAGIVFLSYVVKKLRRNKNTTKSEQYQKGGAFSQNMQIGSININQPDKEDH